MGKGSKGTSKSNDDNKYERMLDGATGHNDGQVAGDYDQMGVDQLMSTEVPTQKTNHHRRKRDGSSESETNPSSRTTQTLSCIRSSPTSTRRKEGSLDYPRQRSIRSIGKTITRWGQ